MYLSIGGLIDGDTLCREPDQVDNGIRFFAVERLQQCRGVYNRLAQKFLLIFHVLNCLIKRLYVLLFCGTLVLDMFVP